MEDEQKDQAKAREVKLFKKYLCGRMTKLERKLFRHRNAYRRLWGLTSKQATVFRILKRRVQLELDYVKQDRERYKRKYRNRIVDKEQLLNNIDEIHKHLGDAMGRHDEVMTVIGEQLSDCEDKRILRNLSHASDVTELIWYDLNEVELRVDAIKELVDPLAASTA